MLLLHPSPAYAHIGPGDVETALTVVSVQLGLLISLFIAPGTARTRVSWALGYIATLGACYALLFVASLGITGGMARTIGIGLLALVTLGYPLLAWRRMINKHAVAKRPPPTN